MPSEAIFFNYAHIFNLGLNRYMLRYPRGVFKNYLENEDKDIIQIITKDNLNNIHIVNRDDEYEYIYIWKSDDGNNSENEYIIDNVKVENTSKYFRYEKLDMKTQLLSE